MKQATMTAVYGRRGCGKTTRAAILARAHKRVIVFDPNGPRGRWGDAGFPFVDWSHIAGRLAADRCAISYQPRPGHEVAGLHALAGVLFKVQAGAEDRRVLIVVEEMQTSFPVHNLPAEFRGFYHLCERGRHWGIDAIGITQRPSRVSTVFRGNCEETYIFALDWVTDVDAVCSMIGRENRDRLRGQAPHSYLHYQAGRVTAGKNPKIS